MKNLHMIVIRLKQVLERLCQVIFQYKRKYYQKLQTTNQVWMVNNGRVRLNRLET